MKRKKIIGYLLISLPFIALFIYAGSTVGVWTTIAVYAAVAALVCLLWAGVVLITPK